MNVISLLTGAAFGAASGWLAHEQQSGPAKRARAQEVDALRVSRQALEAEVATLRAALAEREVERDAARAELAAREANSANAQRELEAMGASLRQSRGELDAMRRNADVFARDAELRARASVRQELEDEIKATRQRAETILSDARREALELTGELRARSNELAAREKEAVRVEAQLRQQGDALGLREQALSGRDKAVSERERALGVAEAESAKLAESRRIALEAVKQHETEALERVAGLSAEEARSRVIDEVLEDAKRAAARDARQIEDLARDEAERKAKRIIGIAVQRYAGEYAGERAVTSVQLPNDELKGRIIGREGRNIRTFQEVTGCDLVIDDTPETIVVSSFDPVRREMARLTLEKLIQDGRIHPTKIEEFFNKSKDEVERTIKESAEQAVLELGIGRLHPDLMRIVGQLRYRYSYAQNILRHSIEVGHMCGLLAQEMGLNPKLARRAGLLHDIGKAVTHEQEGGHAVIGGQMARKAGEDEMVINAIASHHDDEPPKSVLAHLTAAADAISGARPGARREMLESYVRRLEELEKICSGFKGVEKSFAIQAGREVRVLVEPGEVDDLGALTLSRDIARKIESEMAYPGQIRVTVVRETRAVDYAR
ncbi:MAG: ribonuclease Y [Myxococcales bacterium]|nr:ribonuclease Y [Myxococcales bacterium]